MCVCVCVLGDADEITHLNLGFEATEFVLCGEGHELVRGLCRLDQADAGIFPMVIGSFFFEEVYNTT